MKEYENKALFTSIMSAARESFAPETSITIDAIEGINGLQIIVKDRHTNKIIKKSPLVKHLVKIGYKIVEMEQNP